MTEIPEALLRSVHTSLCIRWGTTVPYAVGRVTCEKVGFAAIPCVRCTVNVPERGLDSLVPIVRQRVFGELAERGWDDTAVAFRPTVRRGRERLFVDENESSDSLGRRKRGVEWEFHFEITDRELKRQAFPVGQGSFALIPERSASCGG